jgi:uncharacterized membrane protein SirB2
MITLKVIFVVIGIFLLFVAGLWGWWGAPADGRRWVGINPGWFGLALLYLSQYVA